MESPLREERGSTSTCRNRLTRSTSSVVGTGVSGAVVSTVLFVETVEQSCAKRMTEQIQSVTIRPVRAVQRSNVGGYAVARREPVSEQQLVGRRVTLAQPAA